MKYSLLALLPLSASSIKVAYPGDFYHSDYNNFPGTEDFAPKYDRVIPEHFQNQHLDDMFMNSMLSNYAKEGKNEDGTPNGKFYLDRAAGERASREVITTHMGLTGKALDDYMLANFSDTWAFYDVNKENLIEADRMSTFFRYLTKNAALNI